MDTTDGFSSSLRFSDPSFSITSRSKQNKAIKGLHLPFGTSFCSIGSDGIGTGGDTSVLGDQNHSIRLRSMKSFLLVILNGLINLRLFDLLLFIECRSFINHRL